MGNKDQRHPVLPRPRQVDLAFYLLLVSIFVSFVAYVFYSIQFWQAQYSEQPLYRLIWVFAFLINLWLAFKIKAGRGWARTVYLITVVVGLVDLLSYLGEFNTNPLAYSLNILSYALSLIAIILLYRSPAKAWFMTFGSRKSDQETKEELRSMGSQLPDIEDKSGAARKESDVQGQVNHKEDFAVSGAEIGEKPARATRNESGKAGPYLLSLKSFTDKAEAPSAEAFLRDWKALDRFGRLIWAARLLLFLAMLITLFFPWYYLDLDDLASTNPGPGWAMLLEWAGWSCGVLLVPFLLLIIFGAWSILRPGGRMVELYGVALVLWLLYLVTFGLASGTNFVGPIFCLAFSALAFGIEIANFVYQRTL